MSGESMQETLQNFNVKSLDLCFAT
jgi:hypothetical protein